MSGTGLGVLFAIPLVLAGGAAYLAGKAVIATIKGAIGLGVAIHKGHVERAEKRREEVREALSKVEGAMAEEARRRHEEMAKAAREADKAAWAAREAMTKGADALEKTIERAEEGEEAAIEHMRTFLREAERTAEADVQKQSDAFVKTLEAQGERWRQEVRAHVRKDTEALNARIDSVAGKIEERDARYEAYARERYAEAKALLSALEKSYDCSVLAEASYKRVQVVLETLRALIGEKSWAAAASQAGILSETVQLLHVELEQNEAVYRQAQQQMELAAADLEAAVEASHVMLDDDTDEAFSYYVDEECDADFWSDGELSRLWREARECLEQLKSFTFADNAMANQRLLRARRLHLAIAQAHARARQQVVSRAALEDLMGRVVESMDESGWEVSGDPEFVQLDAASGHYEAVGDPRGDLRLRFMKGGDERTIVLHNEYDQKRGAYVQQILRFCDEAGTPDESERAREDAELNRALMAAGVPEEACISCDASTKGRKSRG